MQGLPLGLPSAGDPGLDRARAWRRTYWGGALYWLLADVEIRSRSGNRFGLARALRGIVDAGGSIEIDDWPLEKVLQLGDAATGVPVLAGLYQRMRAAPTPVDLAELWGKLGVRLEQGRVVFDGHAPLAAIRDAITASATHTAAYR
jgi:predicted metalloprotease with PDZ domain